MGARADFEQAKQFQLDWMRDVKNFIEDKEDINQAEVTSHLESKLGKWYYTKGKEKYGTLDPIKKFEVKQVKLHKIVKEIFEAKNDNERALAEELFEDLENNSRLMIELLNDSEITLLKNTSVLGHYDESSFQNAGKPVAWDKTKILMSKTNAEGIIEYVNEVFLAVSGYESSELIDKPHSVVRHPDMPKVIFKLLWDELKEKKPTTIISKNLAKSGKYYWVGIDFKVTEKPNGELTFIANQKGLDNELINKIIDPLYKKLLEIEKKSGEKSSENFLIGYLEERKRSFEDYFLNLIKTGKDTTNDGQKSFLAGLFNRN
jgi:PAS domain S-box-containing protein